MAFIVIICVWFHLFLYFLMEDFSVQTLVLWTTLFDTYKIANIEIIQLVF
jgi:hypothetical protein